MAHLQVYEERRGIVRRRTQYRWRIMARNGRILATGAEGYHNLSDLWHAVGQCAMTLQGALAPGNIPKVGGD